MVSDHYCDRDICSKTCTIVMSMTDRELQQCSLQQQGEEKLALNRRWCWAQQDGMPSFRDPMKRLTMSSFRSERLTVPGFCYLMRRLTSRQIPRL